MALAVSLPSRALLWLGIAGNGGIIALWAMTRTIGVPFGPMPGYILPLGLLDGLAMTLEVVQLAHLAVLLFLSDDLGGHPLVDWWRRFCYS